jgi:hypothetical protein
MNINTGTVKFILTKGLNEHENKNAKMIPKNLSRQHNRRQICSDVSAKWLQEHNIWGGVTVMSLGPLSMVQKQNVSQYIGENCMKTVTSEK